MRESDLPSERDRDAAPAPASRVDLRRGPAPELPEPVRLRRGPEAPEPAPSRRFSFRGFSSPMRRRTMVVLVAIVLGVAYGAGRLAGLFDTSHQGDDQKNAPPPGQLIESLRAPVSSEQTTLESAIEALNQKNHPEQYVAGTAEPRIAPAAADISSPSDSGRSISVGLA